MHRAVPVVVLSGLLACGGTVGRDGARAEGGMPADAANDGTAIEDAPLLEAALESSTQPDAGAAGSNGEGGMQCGALEGGSGDCVPCPAGMPSPGPCDVDGLTCSYSGSACTCTSGCTAGQCCPTTCAQLGFPCGTSGDGCGGTLHCRQCPAGQTCAADGACVDPADAGCKPVHCSPYACGVIDDGCGGKIDCGECFWSCVLSGP